MIDIKKIVNEDQDPKAVDKVLDKLNSYLLTDEEVLFMAVQKKPAVNILPDSVALTTKRIIFCRPKNLGFSIDFEGYYWKEVLECRIKEGILGTDFTVVYGHGETNSIDYIPKIQARRLHAISQEKLELEHQSPATNSPQKMPFANIEDAVVVDEDYEIKALPETSAMTEDYADADLAETVTPNNFAYIPEPEIKTDEIIATLEKLRKYYESGLITQNEYEAKKREVLSRI